MARKLLIIGVIFITAVSHIQALERPEIEFKIFQFPRTMIPRIDGNTDDWDMVGEEYTYTTDLLIIEEYGKPTKERIVPDPGDLDVKVRVGWVKGLNRLYFLYEAYDDSWTDDDIFEIVVDADISGGPIIFNPQIEENIDNHLRFSGNHGQNYHIHTPPKDNQWCMVWGCQPWICRFPRANYVYDYNFEKGESGYLVLEFWITPFDYAPYDGPERAVASKLEENTIIGLSWCILENDEGKPGGRHINLSHNVYMVEEASLLCAFRLMPLEERFEPKIEARWSFKVIDMDRRLVYFKDESVGNITKWLWNFGDGETSTEQNPIHRYKKPGIHYIVFLDVEGPEGKSRYSKHWDVMVK